MLVDRQVLLGLGEGEVTMPLDHGDLPGLGEQWADERKGEDLRLTQAVDAAPEDEGQQEGIAGAGVIGDDNGTRVRDILAADDLHTTDHDDPV